MFLLGLRENPFLAFPASRGCGIPWLVVPSLFFKAGRIVSFNLSLTLTVTGGLPLPL